MLHQTILKVSRINLNKISYRGFRTRSEMKGAWIFATVVGILSGMKYLNPSVRVI
jgi:hypothetical protein